MEHVHPTWQLATAGQLRLYRGIYATVWHRPSNEHYPDTLSVRLYKFFIGLVTLGSRYNYNYNLYLYRHPAWHAYSCSPAIPFTNCNHVVQLVHDPTLYIKEMVNGCNVLT
jgi:hypothetical protein